MPNKGHCDVLNNDDQKCINIEVIFAEHGTATVLLSFHHHYVVIGVTRADIGHRERTEKLKE